MKTQADLINDFLYAQADIEDIASKLSLEAGSFFGIAPDQVDETTVALANTLQDQMLRVWMTMLKMAAHAQQLDEKAEAEDAAEAYAYA